ncbi:hypothetical protein [Bradyrhizobium sp. WSM2793]|uniref:hypothetical protein n=1 Tax=Bradyrhizobium sp. WSM2793 TaxID=1038866 RepID=UPI001FD89581|nr:hypothetical protein [Bradyrhizobium sp. WSM2793]
MDNAPRILVVEDEYLIALELDTELKAAGYRVIGPVPDIDGALELLKVERPDAAILDVNLAGKWITPLPRRSARCPCPSFSPAATVPPTSKVNRSYAMRSTSVNRGGPTFSSHLFATHSSGCSSSPGLAFLCNRHFEIMGVSSWNRRGLTYVNVCIGRCPMAGEYTDWLANTIAARIERIKAANELTNEQLRKSYLQLGLSEALLQLPVPKVWRPDPPKE